MLKKITAILMAVLMVGTLAACGTKEASSTPENQTTSSTSENSSTTENKKETSDTVTYKGDFKAKIIDCVLSKDDEGNDAVTVKYEFTNNSSEAKSFNEVFSDVVYQNGIEQSSDNFYPGEGDWDSYYKSIKDGATTTVYKQYPISNTTNPVEVTINTFDTNDKASKEFTLK